MKFISKIRKRWFNVDVEYESSESYHALSALDGGKSSKKLKESLSSTNLKFTELEIQSALLRAEKKKKTEILPDKFDDYINEQNALRYGINISIKKVQKESLFLCDPYSTFDFSEPTPTETCFYNHSKEFSFERYLITLDEEEIKNIFHDLIFKKIKKIIRNIISRFFKNRQLINIQSPLKRELYEYYDLIFSNTKLIGLNIEFLLINLFYLSNLMCNEERNIRYITINN